MRCTVLIAPRHVGSSRPRDRTCVPCIGRQIRNHWTTREVLRDLILTPGQYAAAQITVTSLILSLLPLPLILGVLPVWLFSSSTTLSLLLPQQPCMHCSLSSDLSLSPLCPHSAFSSTGTFSKGSCCPRSCLYFLLNSVILEKGMAPPLQYSCLGNPMDRGAWQATVREVTESDMTERLSLSQTIFFVYLATDCLTP